MIETAMYGKLHYKLKGSGVKLNSIETGGTSLGIPDVLYSHEKPNPFHGFIELKHVKTFNKKSIKVPWRKGQLAKGISLVKSDVSLLLIMCADDTEDFTFIPGYLWADYYTQEMLYGNNHYNIFTKNINKINGDCLYNILSHRQYIDYY